ncbi:MAG: bifunctional UDP-N-acetylmuramoyl-tripeptide:D-alanyl-D-alanine ligase/alanine racemase [Syntrophothermus sp.]
MDLTYSLPQIASITRGTLVPGGGRRTGIIDILIDSRRLIHPEAALFICLVTNRNDGHRYIPELYEKGVRNFIVSETPRADLFPDANFIVVNDTLEALQLLSASHRARFPVPVIGITGSNGKTIVKEWLFQLMSHDRNIIRSPKSFNSQIGVPLSVWKMDPSHELAVFEAGISQPGEMEKLEKIIHPDIGIFTNIGHAHDEGFSSMQQKALEKSILFRNSKKIIYCRDHTLVHEALLSLPEEIQRITWSRSFPADLKILSIEINGHHGKITGEYQEKEIFIIIPFTDEASVENAIHCWLTMLVLGYQPGIITARMENLSPIAMRLEMKEAIHRCSLINDSYNSDINSLGIALDFLIRQNQHPKKTVILSDILQSGRETEDLYREIAGILKAKKVDRLIGIGPEISSQQDKFFIEKIFFEDTDQFLRRFPLSSFNDEAILLKGARVFNFEKISHVLQQKVHETILEVNLDAMVHNLNYYRSKLHPGTKTMAMVKAFAYGSGSFEIANLLQFHHVDYLAVAYADEGVDLRQSGITLPIMVMNPEEESFDLLLQYNLEPEIYNFRVLEMLIKSIRTNDPEEPVSIHLKIDTGMHRLGFNPEDVDLLGTTLKEEKKIRIKSVFSHLAASEDPEEDDFTKNQIQLLKNAGETLRSRIENDFMLHIHNSAGITRFTEDQLDMVRLGIGLYGVGFNDEEQRRLLNVSTLKTIISQIRLVRKGDTIGYNRKGIAARDSYIAVVPIGYADGIDRRLGNGRGRMFVKNVEVPVTGNVCMDTTMLDITALYDRNIPVAEGDEVIIFGEKYPVQNLASDLGTIPYEILTGISRRVKRIYFHE